MSARAVLPAHGTAERYRIERRDGKTCERCRAEMARLRKLQRANAAASSARRGMHVVEDAADDIGDIAPGPGEMEKAVELDLGEIDESERVPFHRSLSALALQLAREVDGATAATARASSSRQLFDVLKALRSGKEADVSSALDIVLEDFGLPLVPDRPA